LNRNEEKESLKRSDVDENAISFFLNNIPLKSESVKEIHALDSFIPSYTTTRRTSLKIRDCRLLHL